MSPYTAIKSSLRKHAANLFLAMLFYVASRDCAAALALDGQHTHTHLALHVPLLHHEVPENAACGIFAQASCMLPTAAFLLYVLFLSFQKHNGFALENKGFHYFPIIIAQHAYISERVLGLTALCLST